MFLHGYLLVGLLLAGVPVALHLLLRQKPRRVVFPALRFLVARQQTNQRRMRLRHLLLLLLRVAVLVLLVLALARPRVLGDALGSGLDKPLTAVLLLDTSPSMGYAPGGLSRLDQARLRALEFLDEMHAASRVAILDAANPIAEPFLPLTEARTRLQKGAVRPDGGPLNRAVERAIDLLRQDQASLAEPGTTGHLLLIFTDNTRGCWDPRGVQPTLPEGIRARLVDVGHPNPQNLGIEAVELVPPTVAPGRRFEVRVRLRADPSGHENELISQMGETKPDRQPVLLAAGQTETTITVDMVAPNKSGPQPLTFQLGARDDFKADDFRHALLWVRTRGKMLTIAEPNTARIWNAAHETLAAFDNTLRTPAEAERENLADFAVVALVHVPRVSANLWARLAEFVRAGGGLAVVPGGEELALADFRESTVLPAPLEKLADAAEGKPLYWRRFVGGHPLMEPFAAWSRETDPDFAREDLRPFVRRYWRVGPLAPDASVVAAYENKEPALLERRVGRGRVVLFTTPLDARRLNKMDLTQWTNYWQYSSFGLVLIDRSSRYLAGETAVPEMQFRCGVEPRVRVPTPLVPPYTLSGPGLSGNERDLKTPAASGEVGIPQARQPGYYLVFDGRKQPVAGFCLDIAGSESDLTPVPKEDWEARLGAESYVAPQGAMRLRDAVSAGTDPIELLPYLLMFMLGLMTLEGLFANRFYRDGPGGAGESPGA